jgi:aspartyl-tRNA(Asn)/glutamyl-tRNA(Gln) amidotransferase subunit A
VPGADAAVLATATRAGLVCLGKTHLSELAFSGLGVNPVTATPPNVNDPGAAPGGSSSGAAASGAFGLAPAAIGSDTGGSVRIPAAWNDLVGFKTTHGRLSLEGVVPLRPDFDTVGPICRSVEDAALVTAALAGEPAPDLDGAGLAGVRILALEDASRFPTHEGPAAAAAEALDRLARAGARVERGCPAPAVEANALWGAIAAPEAWATWGATIEANPAVMFPTILDRFRGGADRNAAEYIAARMALARARAAWRAATAGHDAVAMPTTMGLPPAVAAVLADPAHFTAENVRALRNTNLGNLLGVAAITLPTGTPCCGLMLMVPGGEDARLLRLAAAAERALG